IAFSLKPRRHVDLVTLGEGHDGLFHFAFLKPPAAKGLHLALGADRVDGFDLHFEELLYCFGDLRLGGRARDTEDDLVGFRKPGGFFRDHWREDDVVIAHAKRSSIALTAALVITSVSRRSTS